MATARVTPQFQEYRNGEFVISTDRRRLNLDAIHKFLANWPGWETDGIPRPTLERALANSLCFGVYEGERQIGFARVVTDYARGRHGSGCWGTAAAGPPR